MAAADIPRSVRRAFARPILSCLLVALLAATARAGLVPDGFVDEPYSIPLSFPVSMAFVPGLQTRMVVTELTSGRVRLLIDGHASGPEPLIEIKDVQATDGESGLLGIAIDPGWPQRPYVYLQYTSQSSGIIVTRYTMTGDLKGSVDGALTIDAMSRHDVLTRLPDEQFGHNAGTLRFGIDGMLYSSLGDDYLYCVAQDLGDLRGKILRLDVSGIPDGPGGPPPRASLVPADNPFRDDERVDARLVWAYGLRNPFRFTVAPMTGELVVGDVGELTYEEVDLVTAGGQNFGWPGFEGPFEGLPCDPDGPADPRPPIYGYDRTLWSTCAVIIAGPIYRSDASAPAAFPHEYDGDLFVSDGCTGFLRRLRGEGPDRWVIAPPVPGQSDPENWGTNFSGVVDWVQGPDGSVYYVEHSQQGVIRRIRALTHRTIPPPPSPDDLLRTTVRPSPGRAPIRLTFALERPAMSRLEIFDVHGRRVSEVAPAAMRDAGSHTFRWDGRAADGQAAPPGVYFARLSSGGVSSRQRFVLLR